MTDTVEKTFSGEEPWMETYTGQKFFLSNPGPFRIDDIAHALSMNCRYNGHCREFYSVAQHSVLLANYTQTVLRRPIEDVRRALMHDAVEVYVADVPRPLKVLLPDHSRIEAQIEEAIMRQFNLEVKKPDWLKQIDVQICVDERAALMSKSGNHWGSLENMEPLGVRINPFPPDIAREIFTNWFYSLFNNGAY